MSSVHTAAQPAGGEGRRDRAGGQSWQTSVLASYSAFYSSELCLCLGLGPGFKLIKENVGKSRAQKSFVMFLFKD